MTFLYAYLIFLAAVFLFIAGWVLVIKREDKQHHIKTDRKYRE